MRKNFFHVSITLFFSILGAIFAFQSCNGWEVIFAGYILPDWFTWTIVGISFLFAYSSLKYIK